jgi:parvulin-like peptidyl-prolyl isomerase
MKKILYFSLMIIFCCSLNIEGAVIDKVTAIVNDDIITASELEIAFSPIKKQCNDLYSGKELIEKIKQSKRQVLKRLIDELLLLQDAQKKGVEVEEEAVLQEINNIKSKFETEEVFYEILKKEGLSIKIFKSRMKKQLILKKYRDIVIAGSIELYPGDLLEFYNKNKKRYVEPEEIRASQIFIIKDSKEEEALKQLQEIMKDINLNNNFDESVKKFSKESGLIKAGDLGFFKKGQMLKPIEDVVFDMKVGDISNIIESDSGYHIVKVTAKKEKKQIYFNEVQDLIRSEVFVQNAEIKYRQVLKKLEQDAYIEIKLELD